MNKYKLRYYASNGKKFIFSKLNLEDYLAHHGILGQKWGIRNGPPYPLDAKYTGEDIRVSKKQTLQRITAEKEKNKGHAYVSFKELDNLRYLSIGSEGLGFRVKDPSAPNGYIAILELKEDLVIPEYQKSIDAFVESVKDMTPKELSQELHPIQNNSEKEKRIRNNTEEFLSYLYKKTTKEGLQIAYSEFSKSLMHNDNLRKKFFDNLKKKGYNAVIDYNDRRFADKPVIVFDREKTIKDVKYKKITQTMKDNAFLEVSAFDAHKNFK